MEAQSAPPPPGLTEGMVILARIVACVIMAKIFFATDVGGYLEPYRQCEGD